MSDRVVTFRRLHAAGCFVVPNPWNPGTARLFEHLGFQALATSSAGLAFDLGRADAPTTLHRDEVLAHVAAIVEATKLPVTADFQAGYGDSPDAVYRSVTACLQTGVAGLSIEDVAPDGLYPVDTALARLAAARAAIDDHDAGVVLTARAECFLTGHPEPLRESIDRLVTYASLADCLYAPGPTDPAQIRAIVAAVAPRPVNVLLRDPSTAVADLAGLGVRRVSVGSALARIAWGATRRAAEELAGGTLTALDDAEPFAALNGLFSREDP